MLVPILHMQIVNYVRERFSSLLAFEMHHSQTLLTKQHTCPGKKFPSVLRQMIKVEIKITKSVML